MSDFIDPLSPDFHPPIKAETAEVHQVEAAKDPVVGAVVEELGSLFRSY